MMKITDHCYALTGLGYIPPWEVNAGFIVGNARTLVVDTGPTALAAQTVYGYALTAAPHNQIIALNTEPHIDHIGGNSFFHSKGIEIYGHELINRNADAIVQNITAFSESIPDKNRKNMNEAAVFFSNTVVVNPTKYFFASFEFDLGRLSAQVILLPGHTHANSGVWVPEDRVLFAGDTITEGYYPNLDEADGVPAWRRWLVSLDIIEALQPAVIIPGHGNIITESAIATEIERIRSCLNEAIACGNFFP
jgi:glyoxylase-like metal-dependent hydrolase (beta-lactamase superfamily II)